MIPPAALAMLHANLKRAAEYALAGNVERGRHVLTKGLRPAELLRDGGEHWGQVFVEEYEAALTSYAERFGPPLTQAHHEARDLTLTIPVGLTSYPDSA